MFGVFVFQAGWVCAGRDCCGLFCCMKLAQRASISVPLLVDVVDLGVSTGLLEPELGRLVSEGRLLDDMFPKSIGLLPKRLTWLPFEVSLEKPLPLPMDTSESGLSYVGEDWLDFCLAGWLLNDETSLMLLRESSDIV